MRKKIVVLKGGRSQGKLAVCSHKSMSSQEESGLYFLCVLTGRE